MLSAYSPKRAFGLTMTELMIVLALSSVVLAIGAPAMGQWVRDIEVRSSAASLIAALHAARSEALTRNATVRLQLHDVLGRPGWQLSCVQTSARCPALIRQQAIDTSAAVRWGATTLAAGPSFDVPIAAGTALPAGIGFDASGAVPGIAAGDDIARIDVTHSSGDNVQRMVVLIAPQGMVRLCQPTLSAGHPQHCH